MNEFKVQWIADAIQSGFFNLRGEKSISVFIENTYQYKPSNKLIKSLLDEIPKLKELQKNTRDKALAPTIDYGIWGPPQNTPEENENSDENTFI